MKKAEMDKLLELRNFIWHGYPSPLEIFYRMRELLDTFEVEPEFTLPVEPEECADGNCENCMFQEHLIGIPCDRIVMPFDKMTE